MSWSVAIDYTIPSHVSQLNDDIYMDPSQLSLALMQRAGNENTPFAHGSEGVSVHDLPKSPTGTNYSPTAASHSKNARRATGLHKHVIPRLNPSNTAPSRPTAVEQQPHAQIRMAQSFGGFADAPGDTQADSQIYKHYTSTVISHLSGDNGTSDSLGVDGTDEGTRAHVDIVNRWDQDVPDHPTSPTSFNDDDVDELSPETQFRMQPTSPVKFMLPETPAMAGRKRNSRGEILSSSTKTPGSGLTTFFTNGAGAGGPSMSLTQLFNATQGATSPLPDAPRSDPVFQRPSPNFANIRHSSPPAATSSPSKLLRSDPSRATTEPRDTYMTMKESQELREHRRQAEAELQRLRAQDDDDWDDEPTAVEEILARRRLKAKIDEVALKSYASLTAPRRDLLVNSRAKPMVISSDSAYITPARSSRRSRQVIGISDDIPEEDLSDDGSTDELGDLPPSTSKARRLSAGKANGIQVPMTSSRPDKTSSSNQPQSSPSPENSIRRGRQHGSKLSEVVTSVSQPENFSQSRSKALGGTQTVAVADSQPENETDPHSFPPPPHLVEPSSLDSNPRIPQSQLSNRSKKALSRSVIDTSSIPRPPITSSPVIHEHTQDRMPSSPPIVFDEHSGGEDHAVDVGANTDEDMELVGSDGARDAEDYEEVSGAEDTPIHSSPTRAGNQAIREEPTEERSRTRVHSTIPESDAAGDRESSVIETSDINKSEAVPLHVSTTTSYSRIAQADTNSTDVYHTARSQVSLSPQKRLRSQNSPSKGETLGFPQLRRLTEIAADPESQRSIGEVDLDVGLITEDFNEFDNILSGSSPVQPARKRRKVYTSKALRSPVKQVNQLPTATPPSARKREDEGAYAAAQAREAAVFTKPAVLKKGRLSRPTHKTQEKPSPSIKRIVPNTSEVNAASNRPVEIAETPQSKPFETWSTKKPLNHPASAVEGFVEKVDIDVPQDGMPDTASQSDTTSRGETSTSSESTRDFLTPNRVLAHFRGGNSAYYPATCLGLAEGSNFRIRFDDETIDQLEPNSVRSLDLKLGDLVKVDLPKMRAKTYVVAGFKNKITPGEEEYPCTDRHGYKTAILGVKPRDSLPKSDVKTRTEMVDVPITSIYVTSTMWPRFKDRIYTHPPGPTTTNISRLHTPSIDASIPGTPKSRSRRESAINMGTTMRSTNSVASMTRSSGLFANMAFAVSFTNQDSERDLISTLILAQGGLILEPGFETLFQLSDSPSTNPTSPSKPTSKSPKKPRTGKDEPFALTPEAAGLGFVALIADTHSRRAKYMQALALNIPCLAPRWIRDCIAQAALLPFQRYLLPAGASSFLGGVVRSRTIALYDPAGPDARFKDVLARRELLLRDQNVLLITGKGKGREERKRPYLFLSHALGAKRVYKCRDLGAAREMLEDDKWDWVYVDGESRGEAEKALFDRHSGKEKGRKRKRESIEDGIVSHGTVNGKRVKVAGDEFVVQSLILGALVEE